ncbi:MAG: pantoate--beta-alanine ligase [Myxococcales bacterium]|nr:pantoate--beta-alanine ligase [Myxococcales bacterium]
MDVLHTKAEMRAWSRARRKGGLRIGFVPTMGFLHDGHLSLIDRARAGADRVVVSIFVNPTQFAPGEDLDRYPRDLQGDLRKCRARNVDAVFLPTPAEMYPPDAATTVHVPTLARPLCGRDRPTHFAGVCTIVTKLFNVVQPDVAAFGEKDFQQLAIVRRMTRDLDLPIEIVGGPIVREPDGLAMSSRNANLTPDQRREAVALSKGLAAARAIWDAGGRDPRALEAAARAVVEAAAGAEIDYVEARHPDDLTAIEGKVDRAVLALAVRFGGTRLIDNAVFEA